MLVTSIPSKFLYDHLQFLVSEEAVCIDWNLVTKVFITGLSIILFYLEEVYETEVHSNVCNKTREN